MVADVTTALNKASTQEKQGTNKRVLLSKPDTRICTLNLIPRRTLLDCHSQFFKCGIKNLILIGYKFFRIFRTPDADNISESFGQS